ncbi:MAG: peptidase S41, partial [Blastocatellia bacterium]
MLWPSISYNGRTIVFEHDFELWKLDTASLRAARLPVELLGAAAGPSTAHLMLTSGIQDLALSPDGKKVAFVVHGEIFAASSKDGGDAMRVTRTEGEESDIAWAPDSRRIVYSSDRDGVRRLFLYDFGSNSETPLTTGTEEDYSPLFSADGKSIAFIRGGHQVILLEIAPKQEKVLATAAMRRPPFNQQRPLAFSPDGKWLAFESVSGRMFTNVNVVAVTGGEAHQISFIPNGFSDSVAWSPDGKYILFDTGQRTEMRNVARIDLVPRTPRFQENEFKDLFKQSPKIIPPLEKTQPTDEKEKAADKGPGENKNETERPVEIVFYNIRERISLLPTGVDVGYEAISPDGKMLLMIAAAAGRQNLYVYSLDELAKEPAVAR